MKTNFSAPKSKAVMLFSAFIVIAMVYAFYIEKPIHGTMLFVFITICALYWVMGYQIVDNELRIIYPGRFKAWDLTDLHKIEVMPNAMDLSFRLLGPGLFAFVGLYYNSKLGWYRVYATNSKYSVVLYFNKHTVVVTPDDPEGFFEAASQAARLNNNRSVDASTVTPPR